MTEFGKTFVLTPRRYHRVLDWVNNNGEKSAPRGIGTTEVLGSSLVLKNPRDRLVPDRERKMNLGFAVAEWYAFMTGRGDIGFFTQFIKNYGQFSSDGKTLDGNYGVRINYTDLRAGLVIDRSQVEAVITKLATDQDSRQAVLSLYDRNDLFGGGGKNTPCTLTMQFLVRDKRLHCLVNMRSADVVKGLTYDMFVFTMVQEYVAMRLNLELGEYVHHAGSLHLYDTDLPLLGKLDRNHRWPYVMTPMPEIDEHDWGNFTTLVDHGLEPGGDLLFFDLAVDNELWHNEDARAYLAGLAAIMKSTLTKKSNPSISRLAHNLVRDPSLKFILRHTLRSAGVIGKR